MNKILGSGADYKYLKARITLNRPKKMNLLSIKLCNEFQDQENG
ncbi:hypothetical protein [Bradyrhizobium japonicum]|nr:hypothetical protein [Bradyrhizobium japonicum]